MNHKVKIALVSPLVAAAATGLMGAKLSCGADHSATGGVKPIGWLENGQPVIARPPWWKPPTYVEGPTPPPVGRTGGYWIRLPRTRNGEPVWRKAGGKGTGYRHGTGLTG